MSNACDRNAEKVQSQGGLHGDGETADSFRPTASWEAIRLRHELLRKVRAFFDDHGFLEVTTPVLSAEVVGDPHIDPFILLDGALAPADGDPSTPQGVGPWGNRGAIRYLQTSPELHMKRLLASGAEAIYQITPAFRAGELGAWHNPEFTMLEWYRAGHSMWDGIAMLSQFIMEILGRDRPEVRSYRDVFVEQLGCDPMTATPGDMRRALADHGVGEPGTADGEVLLHWAMSSVVQPRLGIERPLIVHGFPSSQAALARLDTDDPRQAMRFELYDRGVELANGYDELGCTEELRQRRREWDAQREKGDLRPLSLPKSLMAAMSSGLPASTGVALGFDRLVMLAAGANDLRSVMAFPWDVA